MTDNLSQLKQIWANIELAMKMTKFPHIKPTKDKQFNQLDRTHQITAYDLEKEVVDPENHESMIKLRNY